MNKEDIFEQLTKHGYTNAAVNNSEFPKEIVLEHLELSDKEDEFK